MSKSVPPKTPPPTPSNEELGEQLDTCGLLCPMPVIRTQDAIKKLAKGAVVTVSATDPGTLHDIPAWCRVHGHEVMQVIESADIYTFKIIVH